MAEHVTRLVALLIGLVFSVLSVVVNLDSIDFGGTTVPVEIAFVLGIFSLVAAMGTAIVTYLSSRFRIGLHYSVGDYLSESRTDSESHIRRVLGSYGEIIEENTRVMETNSKRFRATLYCLLVGILFLSTAGTLYIGTISTRDGWIGLATVIALSAISGWYILTGRYLTLEPVEANNE